MPLVLLLWFGIAGGGVFRRGRILLAGVAALALLYALGRYTPLFGVAFDWRAGREPLPPAGRTAIFVFLAALALLCGFLLADYIRDGIPRRRILASIAVARRRACDGGLRASCSPGASGTRRRCTRRRADDGADPDRRGADPGASRAARARACSPRSR